MATWGPRGWTPRRRGLIYCSPACGASCTWAKYQQANKDAKALAKRLGKGWTIRVWENMGWFYQAISPCQRIKVSGPSYGLKDFTAYLGDADPCGGGRWVASSKTPIGSVRDVVHKAMENIAALEAYAVGLEQYGGLP